MSKLTLNNVSAGFAATTLINANNTAIVNAIENTISRDGTAPNFMNAPLDMNGNMILNQANPITVSGFNWKGPWLTNTLYNIGDVIENNGTSYIAIASHLSGTFATDLANLDWQLVATGSLPSQTGNAGKYLKTNGTLANWSLIGSSEISYDPGTTGSVATNVQTKLRENNSVLDYGTGNSASFALALTAASNIDTITVSDPTFTTTPSSATGKNILWAYPNGSNSDNVLTSAGVRGGLFADYDCKANQIFISQITENQSAISGGGFRDVIFVNAVDNDLIDYTAIGQKVTNTFRSFAQGANNGTSYLAQYKDLVGGYFAASGNIQWASRGVSAITADAYQYGIGIASNEMAVHNPSAANGGLAQSLSMAAIQAIIRSQYADEDGTHISRGLFISSNGKRITSGIEIFSDTSGGFTSQYKNGINMTAATVSAAAIIMPLSASGNAGTVIQYDTNDYTSFDRTNNRFIHTIGASTVFASTPNGISIGSATTTGTRIYVEPSTTALSHMRLYPGATPTTPQEGDIWFDGTNLKFRVGGVSKTVTLA